MDAPDTSLSIEVKSKSVEQTLEPLVTQITNLISEATSPLKRPGSKSNRQKALERGGTAVYQAVERFVTVGEELGLTNPEVFDDMTNACTEAREAALSIQNGVSSQEPENEDLAKGARKLLSAVTRMLLLADKVHASQAAESVRKVNTVLAQIQNASDLSKFVHEFSELGAALVQVGRTTGERQNDAKDDVIRAHLASHRSTLERSTPLLHATCRAALRHPQTSSSLTARSQVIDMMSLALSSLEKLLGGYIPTIPHVETANYAIIQLERAIDENTSLSELLDTLCETTHDFTDSPYTNHDERERVLALTHLCCNEDDKNRLRNTTSALRSQLESIARNHVVDLTKSEIITEVSNAIAASASRADEISIKITESCEQIVDACTLIRHVSSAQSHLVSIELTINHIRSLAPLMSSCASTLARHHDSQMAIDSFDACVSCWKAIIDQVMSLLKEVVPVVYAGHELQAAARVVDEVTSGGDSSSINQESRQIVHRAKTMSAAAFSVYLFTRGEGPLRTTNELFEHAAQLASDGETLANEVRNLTVVRGEIVVRIERLEGACCKLQTALCTPSCGKAATFNKVDQVVTRVKLLMQTVAQLVTACLLIATSPGNSKTDIGSLPVGLDAL